MILDINERLSVVLLAAALTGSLLAAGCARAPSPQGAVKIGLGREEITPPLGIPMAGYEARKGNSSAVHDPLYARTLLVQQGDGTAVALMTVSVIDIGQPLVDKIRARIQDETGIPANHILISATHTHSGPDLDRAGEPYLQKLVEGCVASAVSAWKSRAEGRIGFGTTRVEELGRNRRRLLYGGLHPDPQVAVMKIEDARGRLSGVAFNYGCHPTVLAAYNLQFTEDWPYYAIQGIKAALGKNLWVGYYQSAQGDINIGYTAELSGIGAGIPTRTWAYAERKGRQMVDAVIPAFEAIKTSPVAEVEAVSGFFQLPLRDHFPDTLQQAERKAAAAEKRVAEAEARAKRGEVIGRRFLDQVRTESFLASLNLETARWFYGPKRENFVKVQLQAIRIGDAVLASFPGEVFSEIGLQLKQKSPFSKTFVIGLANGDPGANYLPTAEEFPEDNYEVAGTHYSEKAEETLINASLELIRRLGNKTGKGGQ